VNQPRPEKRAVPHINHTPALTAAASAVANAKGEDDAPVSLVDNPFSVHQVREKLQGVADLFEDPSFFFEGLPNAELVAVENLVLLATLLREHLRAGNSV
jgi:hypothetical protein